MQSIRLALKSIRGSAFRSAAIFLAVMAVAGFLLATTLVIKGAENSLDSGLKRLGADLLVVPAGAEGKVESALLMGKPTNVWMSESTLNEVAAITGVEAVSPQIFLSSLYGAACCSVSEMFVVVYDPETDFTITPWLKKNMGRSLSTGEVVGGSYIFVPKGEAYIKLYGYDLTLKGNLAATGTGIDQTMFMSIETAQAMALTSVTSAESTLVIPRGEISTIMVRVSPGADTHKVALTIFRNTLGLVPIESPNLFGAFRSQMNGLLWGFFAITVVVWAIAMLLIGLVFSMAANERRREMAVLKAIGATRGFIFRSLLAEAAILALAGAALGIAAAATGLLLFQGWLTQSLKMPFLFPSIPSFIGLFAGGVALAMVTVTLAALVPAWRMSRQELAMAMRE